MDSVNHRNCQISSYYNLFPYVVHKHFLFFFFFFLCAVRRPEKDAVFDIMSAVNLINDTRLSCI